jgi:hypothetical protein
MIDPPTAPTALRTGSRPEPIGIDGTPMFSWNHTLPQTHWEIDVALDEAFQKRSRRRN